QPVRAEIMSASREHLAELGRFDLVLFLGVLYHLPDPMAALRNVRRLCADRLILETETDLAWVRRPALAYYPGRELSGDPSNWQAPNVPALRAMLRECGFDDIRIAWRSGPGHRLSRAARHLVRYGTSPIASL